MEPKNIILKAVCGSRAYGLDNEQSDTDYKGVFVTPTREILSINSPKDTYDGKDADGNDFCYYEVQKFIKLALGCNPTILEILFLTGYSKLEPMSKMLVDNRHLFLSNIAREKYYGYAYSQMHKLVTRDGSFGNGRNNRYEKHARHCYRLLYQGKELLETGNLTVTVSPEVREELFAVGKLPPNKLVDKFAEERTKFDAIKSVLPDKPDYEGVNKLLLKIRKGNW